MAWGRLLGQDMPWWSRRRVEHGPGGLLGQDMPWWSGPGAWPEDVSAWP